MELELTTDAGIERMTVVIVPDESADFSRGFLGENTPLAAAILYHVQGESVEYHAGDIQGVKIVSVEPSTMMPPKNVAARREATIRKAIDESDRTNAMIFASSFSGKWGDYDPDGIAWDKPESETDHPEDDPSTEELDNQ